MIEVKQAVHLAEEFFLDLVGQGSAENLRLEEVELQEEQEGPDSYWYITLSMPETGLAVMTGGRFYKVFKINAESGQVQSMKMRKLNA